MNKMCPTRLALSMRARARKKRALVTANTAYLLRQQVARALFRRSMTNDLELRTVNPKRSRL